MAVFVPGTSAASRRRSTTCAGGPMSGFPRPRSTSGGPLAAAAAATRPRSVTKYCCGNRSRRFGRGRTTAMLLPRSAMTPPFGGGRRPPADRTLAALPTRSHGRAMTATAERLNGFERRLRSLERELADLRRAAAQEAAAPVACDTVSQASAVPPAPLAPRAFPPPPAALPPAAFPPPPDAPPSPAAPLPASPPPQPFDLSFLFGASALAWTGGAVTLLGIVFFFVLAVDRGWIGPIARVSLGAAASSIVFGAGLWLRRRFGESYASLSAAYATLLAATALYDLLPAPAALVAAGAIAAAGGVLALAWDAETVAGIG